MRAITEMPANTPRPIGRTDNFLPGISNGAGLCEDSAAAADPLPFVDGAEGARPVDEGVLSATVVT